MSLKLSLMFLLPLAMSNAAAHAQSDEGTEAAPTPHQFMAQRGHRGPISIEEVRSRTIERFTSLDTSGDGALVLGEFEPPRMGGRRGMRGMGLPRGERGDTHVEDRLFQRLDVDGNGELSQEELANMQAARRDMMKELVFERLDTSGDGFLSLDEFAAQVARLKELDVNGDGLVTEEERPRRRRQKSET